MVEVEMVKGKPWFFLLSWKVSAKSIAYDWEQIAGAGKTPPCVFSVQLLLRDEFPAAQLTRSSQQN